MSWGLRTGGAIVALGGAIAAATVTIAAGQGDRTSIRSVSPRPTRHIVCDQAVAYHSLDALRRAASSVAVLTATSVTHTESVGDVPFTITRMRVQETIAGTRLAHTVFLRQTGSPGTGQTGCGQLVAPGRRYLAYLTPFKRRPGGPPIGHQYWVVGGNQGLYELRHPAGAAG
jgi:hypothetical protein